MEKKKRVRSPNYPSLTLEKSLDLVKDLFREHTRYPVALEVAGKCWGFLPKAVISRNTSLP